MDTKNTPGAAESGRRRLLKVLALGGAGAVLLPEKWVKPVIDAVIVPAHAQGSVRSLVGIYSNQGTPQQFGLGRGSLFERLAGMLIGSAHAGTIHADPVTDCGTFSNTVCVAFEVLANNAVRAWVNGYQGSSTLYPNGLVAAFDVDAASDPGIVQFSNILASATEITCFTDQCAGTLILEKVQSNPCQTPPV